MESILEAVKAQTDCAIIVSANASQKKCYNDATTTLIGTISAYPPRPAKSISVCEVPVSSIL